MTVSIVVVTLLCTLVEILWNYSREISENCVEGPDKGPTEVKLLLGMVGQVITWKG